MLHEKFKQLTPISSTKRLALHFFGKGKSIKSELPPLILELTSKMKQILLVLTLTISTSLLMSCDSETRHKETISFPLLAGKEEAVREYVSSRDPRKKISVEIIHFDGVLDSHPDIIGYINLSSTKLSKNTLIAYFNTIAMDFFIAEGTSLYRSDNPKPFWSTGRTVEFNEQKGFRKNYIVVNGDEIYVYPKR